MADVMINIRQLNGTISVSGVVNDALLAPFTSQLSSLLSASLSSSSIPASSTPASA